MNKPHNKTLPSNPRRVAAKVIGKVLFDQSFSNYALSEAIEEGNLSAIDKGLCTELCYGTLRWAVPLQQSLQRALDKPTQKIDKKILPHLLVAAYQLQHLEGKIPAHAAVNTAVNEVKRIKPYYAGFANLILRRLGSSLHNTLKNKEDPKVEDLSLAFGLSLPLVIAITKQLPVNEWYDACLSMNQRPKLWLRVFKENESLLTADKHAFVPNAVAFNKSGSPLEIEGFTDGHFMVQDPASQIAAILLDPPQSSTVIDCCAAPGSKSMILKQIAGPKARVIAIDISPIKIQRIEENARRLNLNVEIIAADLILLAADSKWHNSADAILLDAPCSGLGTLRRHPEIKLTFSEEKLANLITLQSKLLAAAAQCLKPKGALVYSVCSFMPEEGTLQIQQFLKQHPQFKSDAAKNTLNWLPDNAINKQNEVQLWPHRHDCDAFFAARLLKE